MPLDGNHGLENWHDERASGRWIDVFREGLHFTSRDLVGHKSKDGTKKKVLTSTATGEN